MRGLAVILFVAITAQVRSSGVDTIFTPTELGEVPWYAHLRVAVRHTGELRNCAGSVIHRHWLLTSARCVRYNLYIWARFGVDVFRPRLLVETNTLRVFPLNNHETGLHDVSIVNLTRHVIDVPNEYFVSPLVLAGSFTSLPLTAKFCSYGRLQNGEPGVRLGCTELSLSHQEDGLIEAHSVQGWTTEFDQGAPLVSADGVQFGILSRVENNQRVGMFLNPAYYREWFESVMEVQLPYPEGGSPRGHFSGSDEENVIRVD